MRGGGVWQGTLSFKMQLSAVAESAKSQKRCIKRKYCVSKSFMSSWYSLLHNLIQLLRIKLYEFWPTPYENPVFELWKVSQKWKSVLAAFVPHLHCEWCILGKIYMHAKLALKGHKIKFWMEAKSFHRENFYPLHIFQSHPVFLIDVFKGEGDLVMGFWV